LSTIAYPPRLLMALAVGARIIELIDRD